jgi:formylglycine-generating enzyme required for sulfatase activity
MSKFEYAYEKGNTRAYRGGCYLHNIDPESPVVIRSWTFPAEVSVRNGFRLVVSKGDTVIEPSRVLRGGGWGSEASSAKVAFQCTRAPAFNRDFIGFRLTVDADFPMRVNRGGKWDEDADDVQNTIGFINAAARGYGHIGFRTAKEMNHA